MASNRFYFPKISNIENFKAGYKMWLEGSTIKDISKSVLLSETTISAYSNMYKLLAIKDGLQRKINARDKIDTFYGMRGHDKLSQLAEFIISGSTLSQCKIKFEPMQEATICKFAYRLNEELKTLGRGNSIHDSLVVLSSGSKGYWKASNVKLDWDKVCNIRKLSKDSNISKRKLAIMFHVSPVTITQILENSTWKQQPEIVIENNKKYNVHSNQNNA